MKKILCNKLGIILVINSILISIYVFLIPLTYLIFQKSLGNKLVTQVFLPIYAVLYIILHIYFYKKNIKKYGIYMYVENDTIVYNNKVFIPKIMITKIVYQAINMDEKTLIFYLCDDSVEEMYMRKNVVKKISKQFNLNIIYDKEARKKYKENKKKSNKQEISNFFKNNKYIILSCIIGLILTVLSFVLHYKINNVTIKVIMCLLCVACGWGQFFFLYVIKIDKDILTRIIVSTIASIAVIIIMTIVGIGISHNMNAEITADCIFFAIYLFPSFVLVGLLALLIMSGL